MTIKKQIQFGTSGHRGTLGSTFTIEHTRAISEAIALYLNEIKTGNKVAVGYDPRTGNSPDRKKGSYTNAVTSSLINQGIDVHFFDSYTPTPVVAWTVEADQLDGGIILTASHNPPNYNGIKFNSADGAPANTEITQEIETRANLRLEQDPLPSKKTTGKLIPINTTERFAKEMIHQARKILGCQNTSLSSIGLAIDAKHGSVAETWQTIAHLLQLKTTEIIHATPQADFGGIEPNPTKTETLTDLKTAQNKINAPIACANDPDGDRHIILDEQGTPLTPEETAVIILEYMVQKACPMRGIASTVASSSLIKTAAIENQLSYIETEVGFKYFTPFLKQCRKANKIGLAVESSGGFTWSEHTLEKCGFLPVILMLFIMAETGKPLSTLCDAIHKKYGQLNFQEIAITYDPTKGALVKEKIQDLSIKSLSNMYQQPIETVSKKDGTKIIFKNGDWVLLRLSGTEPLARVYAESSTTKTETLIDPLKALF